MSIRGCVLDVDGTLIDSNDAHADAWVIALAERGIVVPRHEVRVRVGQGGDKLLPAVAGIREGSPDGQVVSQRRGDIFRERFLPKLQPTRGARALLERMRADGVTLAVATSASERDLDQLLQQAGLADLLDRTTSKNDAARSKPDPDIVEVARTTLGLPAEDVLMLGDTPWDVAAAARAGMGCVAVRCGGWDDEGLRGAAAIYDDPEDLLAHWEGSPFRAAFAREGA